jgi:hypothetical protein
MTSMSLSNPYDAALILVMALLFFATLLLTVARGAGGGQYINTIELDDRPQAEPASFEDYAEPPMLDERISEPPPSYFQSVPDYVVTRESEPAPPIYASAQRIYTHPPTVEGEVVVDREPPAETRAQIEPPKEPL